MSKQIELVITGGVVIDPARNFHGLADVWINEGKIMASNPGGELMLPK